MYSMLNEAWQYVDFGVIMPKQKETHSHRKSLFPIIKVAINLDVPLHFLIMLSFSVIYTKGAILCVLNLEVSCIDLSGTF